MENPKTPTQPTPPTAPGISEDLQKRIDAFNLKLNPILAEFRLGIGAAPFLAPDGRVAARPLLVDADTLPKPPQVHTPPPVKNGLAEG